MSVQIHMGDFMTAHDIYLWAGKLLVTFGSMAAGLTVAILAVQWVNSKNDQDVQRERMRKLFWKFYFWSMYALLFVLLCCLALTLP
jgi:hypothetical protein